MHQSGHRTKHRMYHLWQIWQMQLYTVTYYKYYITYNSFDIIFVKPLMFMLALTIYPTLPFTAVNVIHVHHVIQQCAAITTTTTNRTCCLHWAICICSVRSEIAVTIVCYFLRTRRQLLCKSLRAYLLRIANVSDNIGIGYISQKDYSHYHTLPTMPHSARFNRACLNTFFLCTNVVLKTINIHLTF